MSKHTNKQSAKPQAPVTTETITESDVRHKTYKIIENRKIHFIIPAAIIVIAVIFMVVNLALGNGLFNYDVEFAGGTSIQLDLKQDFDNSELSKAVEDVTGQTPRIQKIVGTTQARIKMKSIDSETRVALFDALAIKYPKIDRDSIITTDVNPTVSGEMRNTAVLAISVALAAMFIYIAIRFRDVKIGGSTILNQLLNALVVIGFYAILRIPLNDSFIIVVLTILGYSINSTIVVFDRVRENKKLLTRASSAELIDRSVSQTLRRFLFAALTTLFTIVTLYILGVQSIKDFALPIALGVIFGTYSSACFSGCLWYSLLGKSRVA